MGPAPSGGQDTLDAVVGGDAMPVAGASVVETLPLSSPHPAVNAMSATAAVTNLDLACILAPLHLLDRQLPSKKRGQMRMDYDGQATRMARPALGAGAPSTGAARRSTVGTSSDRSGEGGI